MFDYMKIRHLLGVNILGFILFFVVFILSGANEDFATVSMTIILYVLVPYLFFGYYYRKNPYSLGDVLFYKGLKQWILPLFAIVGVSITFSLSTFWLALFSLEPIFPSLVEFLMEEVPFPTNPVYLFIEILAITILAPIVEEFFFRGVILHRLMKKTSMWGGILISSLLFGILHADIIGAFFFGMIACLLYLRTGNLLLPILMHMLNNSLAVILGFFPIDWFDSVLVITREDITSKAVLISIMLVISSLLTVYITVRLAKGLSNKREEAFSAIE